jgi:hypothetical protein
VAGIVLADDRRLDPGTKESCGKACERKKERKKARKKERKNGLWKSGNLPKKQAASHFPTGPTTGGFFQWSKGDISKKFKRGHFYSLATGLAGKVGVARRI